MNRTGTAREPSAACVAKMAKRNQQGKVEQDQSAWVKRLAPRVALAA
jgi:hypothetical protein